MAAGETGTVFLETSLGTRLAVSFPARATTVADLKRQVSSEHAACFPRIGPIAVTSLQIELDGSWFLLTDSMAVQAAFEWVKGPWRLLVEAHELRPDPLARKDAKCGTDDTESNASHPVIADHSSQYLLPPGEAPGGNDIHASSNGISDSPQMENQQDKAQEGGEHALCQREDVITMPQGNLDLGLASGNSDAPPMNQEDKSHQGAENASGQLKDGITMPQECSGSDLAAGDSDTLMNQLDKSHEGVEHASGQVKDGITMPRERSDSDLAAGDNDTPPMNQQDKFHEDVEHASGQVEDGITMPQECSDSDLSAGDNDTPPMNQQDKSHEDVEHAFGQLEDGITVPQQCSDSYLAENDSDTPMNQDKSHEGAEHASGQGEDIITTPQESSNLGVAADKDNGPAGSQQKDIIMEPRGKKRLREEDKTDECILINCDNNLSSFASSILKVVSKKKSSVTEPEKLNSVSLLYNLEDCSHGLGEKPSGGQKEPSTSALCDGERSNNGSDIPPFESMARHKSSDKEVLTQRGDKEEPQIAGCTGKISCKRTDVPHCVESMKEDDKGPAPSGHYLDQGKNERATSSITKGHEPCFRRSHQRVAVRKVPMSRATKIYAARC